MNRITVRADHGTRHYRSTWRITRDDHLVCHVVTRAPRIVAALREPILYNTQSLNVIELKKYIFQCIVNAKVELEKALLNKKEE